jgi:hypothetical protein
MFVFVLMRRKARAKKINIFYYVQLFTKKIKKILLSLEAKNFIPPKPTKQKKKQKKGITFFQNENVLPFRVFFAFGGNIKKKFLEV